MLCNKLLAIKKALAEGTLTKIMRTVLGWLIDTTRALTIGLTKDKFVAWSADIKRILHKCACSHRVSYDNLKMLVGCLQHVANVLVPANHFFSHLQAAEARAKRYRYTHLKAFKQDNLHLFLQVFLVKAQAGTNMNLPPDF